MSPTAAAVNNGSPMAPIVTPPTVPLPAVTSDEQVLVERRAHCPNATLLADEEKRTREELHEADLVLEEDAWRWVRQLVETIRDEAVATQYKLFFLRLLRASSSDAVGQILEEMETWRDALTVNRDAKTTATRSWNRDERDGIQALFLLAVDKQMSLNRCP